MHLRRVSKSVGCVGMFLTMVSIVLGLIMCFHFHGEIGDAAAEAGQLRQTVDFLGKNYRLAGERTRSIEFLIAFSASTVDAKLSRFLWEEIATDCKNAIEETAALTGQHEQKKTLDELHRLEARVRDGDALAMNALRNLLAATKMNFGSALGMYQRRLEEREVDLERFRASLSTSNQMFLSLAIFGLVLMQLRYFPGPRDRPPAEEPRPEEEEEESESSEEPGESAPEQDRPPLLG